MSRDHCSSLILWAGAIVSVIAGVRHADVEAGQVRELIAGHVEPQLAALVAVGAGDLEAVRAQPLGDRRADPSAGPGDEGAAAHSSVPCFPARPASVFS